MMLNIRRYILLFSVVLTACAMQSCLDDTFNNYNADLGDGMSDVRATVEFENLTPALHSRTAGDVIGPVSNLQMVIYQVTENDTEFYKRIVCDDLPGYKVTNTNEKEPGDVTDNDKYPGDFSPTGEKTDHADFTFNDLPYGRYKIYAVANVPELKDADCMPNDEFTSGEEHLKSMRFSWRSPIKDNDEMFGYFTSADAPSSTGFEAPIIVINRKTTDIHAWIKRLVSKVTIAYDASELKEAVRVYIKSVTIHDIPEHCYLGMDNKPDSDEDLIANGEQIPYYPEGAESNADHTKWLTLSCGGDNITGGEVNHYESDRSLFFFENMQGDYEGQTPFDKVQQTVGEDMVGKPIDTPEDGPDFKDKKLYGTYIEVVGYYVSQNKDKVTQGPIKYRFMLGKNITYNYDAQRNYHYKLTLKFRGWANEADWHISYREHTPTLLVHEPYYISYLYGQSLDFPARIKVSDKMGDVRNYKLKAEIIENDWWPYDDINDEIPANGAVVTTDEYGFNWFQTAYNNLYNTSEKYNGFAGFLSLIENKSDVIGVLGEDRPMSDADYWKNNSWTNDPTGALREYGPNANEWLSNYYWNTPGLREQIYPLDGSLDGSNDKIKTTYNDFDNSVDLRIPMYTRQAQLGTGSDFSANNPFNNYYRLSRVRFTLLGPDGNKISFRDAEGNWVDEKICRIIQVPRIENPKAIYRKYDNSAPFEIKLMYRSGSTTSFTTFSSDGPWRASIMCQNGKLIKLISKDKTKEVTEIAQPESIEDNYIHGSTDDPIEFTYVPYGEPGENGQLCGVIKVEYNDYNCVHLIIVRKGYDAPVDFGGTKWSCYNVYATGQKPSGIDPQTDKEVNVALTRSPLSIGTFYKRLQYNYGFMESNNGKSGLGWNALPSSTAKFTYGYLDGSSWNTSNECPWSGDNAPRGYGWYRSDRKQNRWDTPYVWADTWTAVGDFQPGQEFTVPTAEDFDYLVKNAKFGFGVAYADDATATAENLEDAYGYTDYSNTGAGSPKGIRACVVYDENDGRNFIFPLGSTGAGRRNRVTTIGKTDYYGLLSYGNVTDVLDSSANQYRPLVYSLFRNAGATYWIKEAKTKTIDGKVEPDYANWDMNYFSIRFAKYVSGALWGSPDDTKSWDAGNSSDACPIKLIYKK